MQSLFLFDEGSLLSITVSLSSAGLINTKGQLRYFYLSLKSFLKVSLACAHAYPICLHYQGRTVSSLCRCFSQQFSLDGRTLRQKTKAKVTKIKQMFHSLRTLQLLYVVVFLFSQRKVDVFPKKLVILEWTIKHIVSQKKKWFYYIVALRLEFNRVLYLDQNLLFLYILFGSTAYIFIVMLTCNRHKNRPVS